MQIFEFSALQCRESKVSIVLYYVYLMHYKQTFLDVRLV